MNSGDQKIVLSCQSGQLNDFGILYDKYIKKIYDFIYYKTTHKETAEDLTSQTFFKALEKINTFDASKGTFAAWLYRIARNNVIDHYRTKKNDINVEDVWDLAGDEELDRDLDNKEKTEQIKKYISKINIEQREIIMMRVWQEMSYQEIAEITGKSEDVCRMTFSRAIKKLKQDMPLAIFLFFIFFKIQ
jgi:RNA polymerase sigma-70 factor (ECF subfamily)